MNAFLTISPNCPIYLAHQDAYALVDSVSFNWQIGNDKIKADLQVKVSAVRVRMTPEQAFLEDLADKDEATYQNELKSLRDNTSMDGNAKEKALAEIKKKKGTARGY